MNIEQELREFRGVCRLFPLPGVVLFPHTVLPLHIFEPRYRQLTADALAGDQLITIVQPRRSSSLQPVGEPDVDRIGCLGKVINVEKFPDGRYAFLLVGLSRVSLRGEVAASTLYRQWDGEILEDIAPTPAVEALRGDLIEGFEQALGPSQAADADLLRLLRSPLPLGMLTDVMAQSMPLPADLKRALLFEPLVANRVDLLLQALRSPTAGPGRSADGRWSFTSPFSDN